MPKRNLHPRQIFPEPVQRLSPAFRSAARRVGFKRIRLSHSKFRFALMVGKRHCRPNLVSRFVVDDSLKHNALRLNDLEICALKRIIFSVGSAHYKAKFSANAKFHLAYRQRESSWPPPV